MYDRQVKRTWSSKCKKERRTISGYIVKLLYRLFVFYNSSSSLLDHIQDEKPLIRKNAPILKLSRICIARFHGSIAI